MKDLFLHDLWESVSSSWKKGDSGEQRSLTEEGRELLADQFLVRRAMHASVDNHYDSKRAWAKVSGRTGIQKRRVLHSWRQWAAVVLVGLGAGSAAFYFYVGKDSGMPIAAGVGKPSGQVELILASGERRVLSQGVEQVDLRVAGKNALVDATEKRVVYPQSGSDTVVVYNELKVPKGGEYSLSLSDGTMVWLNSESSLRFPVTFGQNNREVFLQGEAFFQVSKDSGRPFLVRSGGQEIRVLGTRFNVSAYPTDLVWHTTLVDGAVSIAERGNEMELQPSCQYRIDRTNGLTEIEQVNTDLYTSWMEGKIYFKNMTLEEIIVCLQRWFELDVIYESSDIRQLRFRGTINKYEPMDQVFRNLEQITDLRFVVRGNTVTAMKAR